MSNSYRYNPRPPRAWSRVQNPCTFTDASNNVYKSVYIPLTNQTVTLAQANYEDKLLQKGNILQYKGNSSQLTKKQKYSQLAKGFGPNRTKVFATQSETYTNPNTTGLLRVNSTTLPFPNDIVGQPNNISGPFQYAVPNPNGCAGFSIQDGGNLVCGTFANPCTGEIIQTGATSSVICNPASASNVPGFSTLCWDTKVQTWFPRQRYVMTNSGNKWPQGYKGFVSAVTIIPSTPFLTVDVGCCDVVLNWDNLANKCISFSSYNIYQNSTFVKSVPYPLTSTTINNLIYNVPYSFYVTSVSNDGESKQSNVVTALIDGLSITLSASAFPTDNKKIILAWTSDANQCANGWRLYQNGVLLNSYPAGTLTATISGLVVGNTYTYYVNSLNPCGQTSQSNTVTVQPINDVVQQTVAGNYTFSVPSGALYYNNVTVIGGGGGGGGGPVMSTDNAKGKIGGSGGGGGGITIITNQVPITLPSTIVYSVGSGGAGGVLANGTNGNNSSFTDSVSTLVGNGGVRGLYDDILYTYGTQTPVNNGGIGGTASGGNVNGTGGNGGNSGGFLEPTGDNIGFTPAATAGAASINNINAPGGGGGGGCIYRTAGGGAVYFYSSGSAGGNGGNGAVGGTAGQFTTAAGNGTGTIGFGGSGGGGVGGNNFSNFIPTGNAGFGIYGSGGGGGGASHTSTAGYGPGNGGAGGTGFVGFTVYRMVISPISAITYIQAPAPGPNDVAESVPEKVHMTNADSGKMYIIHDTSNIDNSINLEDYMTATVPVVTIHNNTGKLLTINSSDLVHNNSHSPHGTTSMKLNTMSSARIHNIFYSSENKNLKKAVIF